MIRFLVLATLVKLILAGVLGGTADIPQQLKQGQAFVSGADVLDPRSTGKNPSFFLVGHYAIAGLALLVTQATCIPFRFWIKVPAILSDLVVCLLLRAMPQAGNRAAVTYMLTPITVLLSVYHGQLHSLATAGAVAALWLGQRGHASSAGLALALAASVRQHFAVLILPLLLRMRERRSFALLAFAGLATVVNLPLLIGAHAERALAPAWTYGIWGYSVPLLQGPRVLALTGLDIRDRLEPLNVALQQYGWALYVLWAAVFVVWLWRHPRHDVWASALVFLLGFYTISPGFGVQWLVWAAPFWLVVDHRGAVGYSIVGSTFLAGTYWVWTFNARYGVRSVTANLNVLAPHDLALYMAVGALGFLTWLYCGRAAWRLARSTQS